MTKAQEMLEIADAYEAGLQKMIACGYEEYGPEPQRKHRLIIEALRLAAQADAPAIQPQRMPDCREYVEDYRFEFDGGGSYAPTERERAMLEDALEGYIATQPPAPPKELHWLGDRESSDATRHAMDVTGCVMYFEQQSDCLQFMRWVEALAHTRPECGDAT